MGASSSALPVASLYLLLVLLLTGGSGRNLLSVEAGKTWCVAKPSSDVATLLANINYACSKVDCGVLRKGCPCYFPNSLISHASVAMNLYYQSRGRNYWNCHFKGSGLITETDPSCGRCHYA